MYDDRRIAEQLHKGVDEMRAYAAEMRELNKLLTRYADKKFGVEFWPEADAHEFLEEVQAERLTFLLKKI